MLFGPKVSHILKRLCGIWGWSYFYSSSAKVPKFMFAFMGSCCSHAIQFGYFDTNKLISMFSVVYYESCIVLCIKIVDF